mgnify:CR=1 FL=1
MARDRCSLLGWSCRLPYDRLGQRWYAQLDESAGISSEIRPAPDGDERRALGEQVRRIEKRQRRIVLLTEGHGGDDADPEAELDYGLGVWLHHDGVLEIHGYDAGVSFRSLHHRATGVTATALANTSDGVGIVDALLDDWVRSGSSSDARSGDI